MGIELESLNFSAPGQRAISRLAAREREIATIVVEKVEATATDVQSALSDSLSNSAIRSMLNRLVRKGILERRKTPHEKAFRYSPATLSETRKRAVDQLVEDFFAGSSTLAAQFILRRGADDADARRFTFGHLPTPAPRPHLEQR